MIRPRVAFTDRYGDGLASVVNVQTTLQAFGRAHGDGTNHAVAQLLLNFRVVAAPTTFKAS